MYTAVKKMKTDRFIEQEKILEYSKSQKLLQGRVGRVGLIFFSFKYVISIKNKKTLKLAIKRKWEPLRYRTPISTGRRFLVQLKF